MADNRALYQFCVNNRSPAQNLRGALQHRNYGDTSHISISLDLQFQLFIRPACVQAWLCATSGRRAQIVELESAVTAPCGQYLEGCLRASNIVLHLSYSGVPGLSVLVRHFCSSACANSCDDDAHPAKVRTTTIADTNFIDWPPASAQFP